MSASIIQFVQEELNEKIGKTGCNGLQETPMEIYPAAGSADPQQGVASDSVRSIAQPQTESAQHPS